MPTPRSTRTARRLATFAAALALFGMGAAVFLSRHTSAAAGLQYRSVASGNWNAAATWETSVDGNTWIPAVATPTSSDDTITIRNTHIVSVTAAVAADQLTVNSGGILSVASGVTFTLDDGAGNDLTVDSGGIFAAAGTVTNNGQAQVNGTLRIDDGGFPGGGTGTYAYDQTTGTLFFNHTSGTYGVNNFNFWPTTNGPQNVSVGTAAVQLNVARTVGIFVETSSGIFGAGNLTIGPGATFTFFTGAFVSGSPTYGAGSTLKYATGGTYNRAGEWLPSATSGAGYPSNVQVSANTTLDLPNGGLFNSNTSQLGGNLTIDSGSTLSMGAMTQALTALGNVQLNGTLTLSTALGGDLKLRGDLSKSGGTFTHNNRAVFFEGGATQNITDSGGAFTVPYVVINKTGGTVKLNATDLTTLAPASGASINFVGGTSTLTLNGRTLTLGSSIGNTPAGSGFIGDTSANMSLQDGGAAGSMGTLTFVSGSENLQNLTVNRTGPVGSVTLGSNLTVGGTLTLTAGVVLTDTNTLTVAGTGTATRTSGYIIGTEQKNFAASGNFTFHVGTDNGYSPVDANVTAGTGSLSVKPTQAKHPSVMGADALSRYWTLSGTGITADLTFNYLQGDVAGDENNYQVFKYDGSFSTPAGQSVNAAANFATVNGVSSFSDWTLAEPSSVFSTLSGTKTVCASGCDYVNLTGAAGLFADINASVVDGNIVAQIAGDLTEDGANALNQWTETGVGGYTLSIVPADGTTKTISGNVAAGMIRLDGADRVTIDGRFNGAGRFLVFRNTSTSGATIKLSNDASNNTLRSSVIEGAAVDPNAGTNPTIGVVTIGAGTTTGNDNDTVTDNQLRDLSTAAGVPTFLFLSAGGSASAANSNNTVSDNEVFNFRNRGIYVAGITPDTSESFTITGNTVYQTAARTTSLLGISVSAAGANDITGNTIHDLAAGSTTVRGINLVPTGSGTQTVARNRIYALSTTHVNGSPVGIATFALGTTTINVYNNMVSIVPATGSNQPMAGLLDQAGAGTTVNFIYNTVLVGGTATGAAPTWACVRNAGAGSAATWRDNICFNARTGGGANHFAAGNESTAGSFSSDYNLFVGTGAATAADFMDYGTSDTGTPVSFATWQSSTGGDAASQAANPGGDYTVANMFTSATDLHLNTSGTNPASNTGTPVGSVTNDYDDETRDTVIPDVGADEVLSPVTLQLSQAAYGVGEGAGFVTITVKRTGSSTGAVSVQYATSDGTAEAGSDYTAASGTLNWADGDLSDKSFNVNITDDGDYEGDEIFNVTLSSPTGASLGTPAAATVSINENDAPPASFSIDDVTQAEGDAGTTAFTFTVTKTGAGAASVDFETQDYTAEAGSDYTATSGTLNFASDDTTKQVTVLVNGDTTPEIDEEFDVVLSNPSGADITDDTGTGTIGNDEESVSAGQLIISEFRLRGPGISEPPVNRPSAKSPTAAKSPKADAASLKSSPALFPCGGSKASVTSDKKKPRAYVLSSSPDVEPDMSPEANDEFIELYNNTDSPLLVTTTDGSEGWAVAASDGLVRFIVPQGTIIPPRGHFLSPNLIGYSLYFYPSGDGSFQPPLALGDYVIRGDGTDCFGYELDIPDNAGLALFRTSDPSNFDMARRLDAVGSTAETNALYKEGAGYPALAAEDISKNLEHSFYRSLCSFVGGVGCTTPGVPKDTGDNAADFLFVDTEATQTAAGRRLGAPAPENLASPVQSNGQFSLLPLDRTVATSSPPNRVRDFTEDASNNSTFGTLSIRRRLTNHTGSPVTALRFRIIELTTIPTPSGVADLRARDAADITVTGIVDADTCSSSGASSAPCDVDVVGTTLEQPSFDPPFQPNGGGLNSSLAVGTITFDEPLEDGASVNVQFLLGIQQTGTFRFLLNIEAVTDSCSCPAAPAVKRRTPPR